MTGLHEVGRAGFGPGAAFGYGSPPGWLFAADGSTRFSVREEGEFVWQKRVVGLRNVSRIAIPMYAIGRWPKGALTLALSQEGEGFLADTGVRPYGEWGRHGDGDDRLKPVPPEDR